MRTLPRLASVMLMSLVSTVSAQDADPFQVYETTIAEIREALHSGRTDCRAIIAQSLRRIDAFDKDGPRINAIVRVNPEALRAADSLDLRFESSGMIGPLHCVPMVVKENMETVELPTTAGSLSLQDFMTNRDATMVRQIKEAGAIIVAKANMAEFAFSPYETVSSILPGYTRNPYVLDRVTAGSSGGTAAAIAASYGTVGLGTDTGNSIRGPSAHQALVGIRSTMGLTSRSGIVPLSLAADIAGPMARTVSDAAAVFQVVVGADPNDPVTAGASEHLPVDYMAALRVDALRGSRLGVLTQAYMRSTTDSEVVARFQEAIEDLRGLGTTVIPDLSVDSLDVWRRALSGACSQFKFDLESWLAEHGDSPPKKTLDEIIRSRQYHPSIESRLRANAEANIPPEENPGCRSRDEFRARLRGGVLELMLRYDLDALIYPTWSNPPRLIGDLNTPHGDNNQLFSPSTGFPAVTVPMGYLRDGSLPAGLQFFGRPWGEATLIGLAYAYEQGTRHRRPPVTTPPLP